MNKRDTTRDGWAPCPSGELERMARRGRLLRQRRTLKQLGGALALIGSGGYFVGYRLFAAPGNGPGGIACEKALRLLRDYAEDKLDAPLTRKLASHLDACPDCRLAYRRMLAKGADSV